MREYETEITGDEIRRVEKPKKRRPMGEFLDLPRQWIVKSKSGIRTVFAEARASLGLMDGASAYLMGTHESEAHARKRVGW